MKILKLIWFVGLLTLAGLWPRSSQAMDIEKIGIHVLSPAEFGPAKTMLSAQQSNSRYQYVTLPISISAPFDCQSVEQTLTLAKDNQLVPLVRLTTKFEDGAWQIPTKRELVEAIDCLARVEWPSDQRHVIVFNEVNHAPEWGGRLAPAEYAKTLQFVANWAHTSSPNFVIMPAAMDLAAPNSPTTADVFSYLTAMHQAEPDVLVSLDAWNSHSYPNPGFIGSPQDAGRTSLRGYQHELAFLSQKLNLYKTLPVYITETGWRATRSNSAKLAQYYQYASRYVWSDPRVVAVTPFLFQGAPGPFSEFSFLIGGQPTAQYQALQNAIIASRTNLNQLAWLR